MIDHEQEPAKSVPPGRDDSPSAQGDVDRRRKGRLKYVSPRLIPLLRFKPPAEPVPAPQEHLDEDQSDDDEGDKDHNHDDDNERDDYDLGIAQGIGLALLLSIPFWLALAVFWYLS